MRSISSCLPKRPENYRKLRASCWRTLGSLNVLDILDSLSIDANSLQHLQMAFSTSSDLRQGGKLQMFGLASDIMRPLRPLLQV